MGKNNKNYLAKMQANKERDISIRCAIREQMCVDAMTIAANKTFHRRGKKIIEFLNCFYEEREKNAKIAAADGKDDEELDYTKGTIDAKLKYVLGEENFVPWEVRYNEKVDDIYYGTR